MSKNILCFILDNMDHLLRNKILSNTDNIISSIKREHESSDDDNFEETKKIKRKPNKNGFSV